MKLDSTRRRLTRDFVSLIVADMKNLTTQEDFIRSSVAFSCSEFQNAHKKIDQLVAVKEAMHQLNVIISDYCIEQIEGLRRATHKEETKIDFLDTIDPRAIIKKREAALFCGRSESWLQKGDHKDQFDNQINGGLNVLSFASYLKEFKPLEYQVFTKNYTKHTRSKIR